MRKEKNLPLAFFGPSDGFRELREEPKGNRRPVHPGSCLHADEEAETRDGAVTCPPPSTSLSRAEAESPTTCTPVQHC